MKDKHQELTLKTLLRCLCFLLFIISISAPLALAAEKYKVGEEVQVLFLNEWRPATIRDVDKKGSALCEFEFAAASKLQIFNPDQIRRPYEADAIARGRLWSDASGKYNVKAALLKISGGKVELRTEEMKEISIAIEKLSPKDQSFIKQFQNKAGLAAVPVPRLPEVESFNDSGAIAIGGGKGRRWGSREDAHTEESKLNLAADPVRKGLELKQAGVGFPAVGFAEKVSSLMALGGADNWILASIGENERQPTRLMWVSLTKQAVKRIQMLPAGEMLMDYHAASRQLLTYSKRKSTDFGLTGQPVLTVWQTEPATEEPKAVVSWHATIPDDKSWHNSVPWVRFANDAIILQRTETHRILAWNIKERALAWQTTQESFFAPEPRMSAGGKYLFLPEDGGLRICDSLTGQLLGQLPMDGCSGVSAHPAGRLIAVLNRSSIYVADITGAQATRKLEANSVGTPFTANFDWVGTDLLSFDGQGGGSIIMFSLKHQLPIWTYQFDSNAYWGQSWNGARKRGIVDDHLVYAATFTANNRDGLAVGAVQLPSGKAAEALEMAKADDFLIIKPGAKFRVDITALDHEREIRQAIMNEITVNGWVYDALAPNSIEAEYKRGQSREIRYELQSMRGGGREVQSANIMPFEATIKIKVKNDEVWATMSSSGPPPVVMMREGDTLQSEVDRANQPVWSFYQTLDIPAQIIDPKKRGGLGTTAVTNRGLVENGQ